MVALIDPTAVHEEAVVACARNIGAEGVDGRHKAGGVRPGAAWSTLVRVDNLGVAHA